MGDPVVIDTMMHGLNGLTAAYLVSKERTALIETGPKSSLDAVMSGLQRAGIDSLDYIVVTHIHLDHAGAAGSLARRFPDATVAVHPLGAPHLIDPAKLWSSATRIYGDRMEELWGGIDPIEEDRIQVLDDGDKIDLGGRTLQAFDTPGHARHHHCILDDETGGLFAGDAIGVALPEVDVVRPATPPPEFDLEQALASIEKIEGLGATSLWPTHFGPQKAPPLELCRRAADSLEQWASWVKEARAVTRDLDEAAAIVKEKSRSALERDLGREAVGRLEQTTSYRMNVSGYMRYFDKREGAASS